MKLELRPGSERGRMQLDWLDTRYTFSFGEYFDPEHMGFRALRVINEDRVAPGTGFGRHPHQDMEILTYVLSGAVRHEDSAGGAGIVRAGELQRMTAGTGITHSEQNASADEELHLLQIWVLPEREGLAPGYEQREVPTAREGELVLLASRTGGGDALRIHQDAQVFLGIAAAANPVRFTPRVERHYWVQVTRGSVLIDGRGLEAGDGASISAAVELTFESADRGEFLLFDLA